MNFSVFASCVIDSGIVSDGSCLSAQAEWSFTLWSSDRMSDTQLRIWTTAVACGNNMWIFIGSPFHLSIIFTFKKHPLLMMVYPADIF